MQINDRVVPTIGTYKGSPARVVEVHRTTKGRDSVLVQFGSTHMVRYDEDELKVIER